MRQDQPFIQKSSLGGPVNSVGQSLRGLQRRANSISQVDGISDMVPACQLCAGRTEKGQWSLPTSLSPALTLMTDTSFSALYATGAFQSATPVMELRGDEYD